jgi:hypothetical protein
LALSIVVAAGVQLAAYALEPSGTGACGAHGIACDVERAVGPTPVELAGTESVRVAFGVVHTADAVRRLRPDTTTT